MTIRSAGALSLSFSLQCPASHLLHQKRGHSIPEGVCAQLQLQADITSWLFQRLLSPPLFPSLPGGIQPHSWLEVTLLQRSELSSPNEKINHVKSHPRASLVAQWLRICLPMQGTRVRALAWEDPTCRGATRPVCHSY